MSSRFRLTPWNAAKSQAGPAGRRPEEVDMGHIFRTDRDMSDANQPTPILDRVWDATRPPELAPEQSDRIWAEVQRACDQPRTLQLEPSTRSRRSRPSRL